MFYGLRQDHETHGLRVVEPQGRCGRDLPGLDAADAGADDFIEAFYAMLVGLTFSETGVLRAMKDFA